jgi:Concanavalin A-like lectin/glucanases superfamily
MNANTNPASNALQNANQAIQSTGNSIGQGVSSMTEQVRNGLSQFGNPQEVMSSSKEFLQSNTLVAKIALTLLVFILFVFLLFLGLNIIGYWNQGSANPYLVPGMIYGSNSLSVTGKKVERSNNQQNGMEYTWSFWIQLNDVANSSTQYQHVFNKGNGNYDQTPIYDESGRLTYAMGSGLATVNNGPGVYLTTVPNTSTEMALHVVMDTVDPTVGPVTLDVTNIPMNKKWVHVAVRLENTILDVYVNGTISGRMAMSSVAKQNYGDVYVCQNGGFSGFLSNLRYYSRAISAYEINQEVAAGPNTTASNLANMTGGSPYYLSSSWYFSKVNA